MRERIFMAVGLATFVALVGWSLLPRDPAPVLHVTVPPLSGEASDGALLFEHYCAECHGPAGGGSEDGPPLIHKLYAPSHHDSSAFYVAALRGARAHHWNFGPMPPVEGITNSEIGKIVAFVRKVQKANGIE